MYRFLLTPRWWGINVFVVLAIPFCIFMGSWQLGRFEDRIQDHETATTQNASEDQGAQEPARPLTDLLPVDKATVGKQTTVRGRYDDQLLVPDRKLDDRDGYYVLTLLRTDTGRALPVVRGWLPGDPDPAKAPAPPTGEVTVTGALQASESPGSNGVSGRSGWPDGQTGAISAAMLLNLVPYDVYDAWVTLNKGDSGMRAVPVSAPENTGLDLKAFQNLGYTGEWFAFVGFVIFMWFRLLRREAELARDAELGLVPEDEQDERDAPDGRDEQNTGGGAEREPRPSPSGV
ncbi:SURF1 family protein [Streptomyces lancefieldiae]|uniref:SURF1-like protein n=1 Tax=Streptomyces lancefieldiae TaxID=3075520 RepID=A0ABU3AU20_9ACTN|nr:SURF1 family protein [Streptomyces sp. DSM 40712]MDT0613656.1 SURF1 family protein [Streptomyces sp. DSM 40712]